MSKKIIYILQKEEWNAFTGEIHTVTILSTTDRALAVESAKKLFEKALQNIDIPDNIFDYVFLEDECKTLKEGSAYHGYYSDESVTVCYDVMQMVMNQFYNENPNP